MKAGHGLRLILTRHGETQRNKEGRILGINDPPLNATRLRQLVGSISPLDLTESQRRVVSLNETWNLQSLAPARDGPIHR